MKLSDNLRKIRKMHNLSQEDLAEKLNVSRQSVSKWESNQAYPEMDKMIQLCKMFNLNIDDLLNNDIGEANNTKKAQNNVNKYISNFLDYITKTINMFSSMKFKEKLRCVFEQIIIICALIIISNILKSFLGGIFSRLFLFLGHKIYNPIIEVLNAIYLVICLIVGIMIVLNTFKARYLDYYTIVENEDEGSIEIKGSEEKEKKLDESQYINSKKHKIIIRDPKHSEYNFITAIGKALVLIIKIFAFYIGILVALSLVFWAVSLVGSFIFIKTGLTFVGALIGIVAVIGIHYVILKVLYMFIFNAKSSKSRLALVFFISLVILGLGGGLFVIGLSDFEIANRDNEKYYYKEEYKISMDKNLIIIGRDIKFNETSDKDIKITTKTNKYHKVTLEKEKNSTIYRINNLEKTEENAIKILKETIKDINNKVIVPYDDVEIIVYGNKTNLEIIEKNRHKYFNQ